MSNLTRLFQVVILKKTLILMCLISVCFWRFHYLKSDCLTFRHLLCEKNTNIIRMCGG